MDRYYRDPRSYSGTHNGNYSGRYRPEEEYADRPPRYEDRYPREERPEANPFDDYLPEPPAFNGKPKPVATQLTQQQIDKANELGITPECAHQLLMSLRKLFQVPVVLDGRKQYPLIAFYFSTSQRIPGVVQTMSVQISDIDKYRIVQAPYKKVIDYLASLPNAKHDPVCMQPYFE